MNGGKAEEMEEGRLALVNGRLILPYEIATGRALVVEGRKILGIAEWDALGADAQRLDVGGRMVAPGLIDLHIHGAQGRTFNEPTAEAFAAILRETTRRGVTALLATVATAPVPDLVACLEFSREWMKSSNTQIERGPTRTNADISGLPRVNAAIRVQPDMTQVLGVHLEGPYFSPAQAGAQDPQNLRTPDDGTLDSLLEHYDVMRIMTYAPELPGALGLTARLAQLGVVPAAGHSSARDEEVLAAMQLGLRHIIHIWSGQSSTVREGPWRKPGLLEASLVFGGLSVEMIADNKHLPPTLMKLAYQCIGPDRLCVVSDATNGAGLAEGARFQMGQVEYEVHDGVGMVLDRSAFAGSTTLLNAMLPILTQVVGIPLVEAVRMASLGPARVIGADDRKGSLEPGKDADLVIFEEDFSAWRVMIGGQWVYSAEATNGEHLHCAQAQV